MEEEQEDEQEEEQQPEMQEKAYELSQSPKLKTFFDEIQNLKSEESTFNEPS